MKRILIGIGVAALFALAALYFLPLLSSNCLKIEDQKSVAGSQGYRIWSGETLKSFEHAGKRVCVPQGWQAVGATEEGTGWATFEKGMTGVLIRSDAFTSRVIEPTQSSYSVTILYPITTDEKLVERYVGIIENAFDRVGRLFNDVPKDSRRPHTVLITAGITGNERIYPDPTANISIFMRTPEHPRAEELFIHAVTHLYNRHRIDLIGYEKLQAPFAEEDWQELEATWAETAFTMSDLLEARVDYLYNVHTAVRTGDFSLITEPPFNDQTAFEKITENAVVKPGSPSLDYQYGHYILAPLSMFGVEGLLRQVDSKTDVEDILRKIHNGKANNFFDELKTLLTAEQMEHVRAWFEGEETVPKGLVDVALDYYKQN